MERLKIYEEIIMNNMAAPIFQTFCKERNLSPGSIKVYEHALKKYTEFNNMSLDELIDEADIEEEQRIRWKRRTLKSRLIDFRNHLIDYGYAKETITTMMKRVTTFYRHYEIEIHHLPHANIKRVVDIKIPTKEDLQNAIELSNPLMQSIIEFISSTGLSHIDVLKLTVQDFIIATKEYHNKTDIYDALDILKDREDVVPMFALTRTKTGKFHYTFCSPEASNSIVNYLLARNEKLTPNSKLFKISYNWLSAKFEDLNEKLDLGVTEGNEYCVLRCHTLRKYHATTLRNDGLSIDIINSLQGKAKNKVDSAYFVDTPEKLKEMYCEHVDCLCLVSEVTNFSLKSEGYRKLEAEMLEKEETIEKYNDIFSNIDRRLKDLEEKSLGPISEEEFDDLFS